MLLNPVIFREYDVRGVYNKHFDPLFATGLAKALCKMIKNTFPDQKPTVAISYDARHSSPVLAKAIAKGVKESGGHAIHLGLTTTALNYFSTFEMAEVNGAVMITGSHNPPEYNGFKISVGDSTLYGDKIQELKSILEAKDFLPFAEGSEENYDIFPQYIAKYKEEFKDLKPLRVVLDCGNGAAGCVARDLYQAVGLDPEILFEEPNGDFPNHHPDPTVAENLEDLIIAVKKNKAVVGIGFDGDADRIGLVDSEGRVIYGDELIVLCSQLILKDHPGAPIVGDVKCSDRMYTALKELGGTPIMWKTGHSLIKQKIKDTKSPFGGELSGHIFFADRNYGYDDALYAGLRVIEVLSQTGKTIPELLELLPPSYSTPEIRIDTTEEKKHSIVEVLKNYFHKKEGVELNEIDGIRVSYPDGWALARASNTQPVLVLRFEASTQEGLDAIKNEVQSLVDPLL